MLPTVKIEFANGALGSVTPDADGVAGLIVTAVAKTNGLQLNTAYLIRKLDDLAQYGVTNAVNDDNALLYRHVKEFYDEAGDGAELWIMGVADSITQSGIVDKTNAYAKKLLMEARGRITLLGVAVEPNPDTGAITNGLDSDLTTAMLNAQALAEWATESMYAPAVVLLEARRFNGTVTALPDLTTNAYNRVGVLLGDTSASTGAATGLLLGRAARIPVQRHIGRVRDLALKTTTAYIGDKKAEEADVETINNNGFITFRTFTGKSGYFFSDDSLATADSDDYRSLARRRTVDKAYRIAYDTLLEYLNDEIPVTNNYGIVPSTAKSWESSVERAIISRMTDVGNLGVDTTDAADKGVKCFIDYNQNVVSTGRIEIVLQIKPYGYAKYIDVKLGFITITG
jgi:hypothetical protein